MGESRGLKKEKPRSDGRPETVSRSGVCEIMVRTLNGSVGFQKAL